eukprot:scaffold2129_cov107-Isochrysis_galbana.AAC.2
MERGECREVLIHREAYLWWDLNAERAAAAALRDSRAGAWGAHAARADAYGARSVWRSRSTHGSRMMDQHWQVPASVAGQAVHHVQARFGRERQLNDVVPPQRRRERRLPEVPQLLPRGQPAGCLVPEAADKECSQQQVAAGEVCNVAEPVPIHGGGEISRHHRPPGGDPKAANQPPQAGCDDDQRAHRRNRRSGQVALDEHVAVWIHGQHAPRALLEALSHLQPERYRLRRHRRGEHRVGGRPRENMVPKRNQAPEAGGTAAAVADVRCADAQAYARRRGGRGEWSAAQG